jgi:hypothetical protein
MDGNPLAGVEVSSVIAGMVVGGFCGFLFGLMTLQVARYASFVLGRMIGGSGWIIFSMVAGAVVFGWWAACGGK